MPLAEIDPADLRIGGNRLGRPFDQDAALHHDRDALRQTKDQIHVVLDDQ